MKQSTLMITINSVHRRC